MRFLFLLLGLVPFSLSAQWKRSIPLDSLAEDARIVCEILREGHPLFHDTLDLKVQARLDLLAEFEAEEFAEGLPKSGATPLAFSHNVQRLLARFGDGHLIVAPDWSEDGLPLLCPLAIQVMSNGTFINDIAQFGIPVGATINSVTNPETGRSIRSRSDFSISTDGNNQGYIDFVLGHSFAIELLGELGLCDSFQVSYTPYQMKDELAITIPAQPFDSLKLKNTERASYFPRSYGMEPGFEFFQKIRNRQEPFLYRIDSLDAALLIVHSFGTPHQTFPEELGRIYQQLTKWGVRHLIIDVRGNLGGYRNNALNLYRNLAQGPFQEIQLQWVSTLLVPHPELIRLSFPEDPQHFIENFYGDYQPDCDCFHWAFDPSAEENLLGPPKKEKLRYQGETIQVLIDGGSFSASGEFAVLAKLDPRITLLGQETGGGYPVHYGDLGIQYALPHSGVLLWVFMPQVVQVPIPNLGPSAGGIPPDIQVPITPQDLINLRDPVLEKALERIKK